MKLPAANFCIWQRALPRSRLCLTSRVRKRRIIPPSRYGSLPTQHPAARRMRSCASWATDCRRCGDARSSCSIIRVPAAPSQPAPLRKLHPTATRSTCRLIAFVTLSGLKANLPLEVPRDFVPAGFVALQPILLSVVSSLSAKTLRTSSRSPKGNPANSPTPQRGAGRSPISPAKRCNSVPASSFSWSPTSAAPRRRSTTSSAVASRWSSTPIRRWRARCRLEPSGARVGSTNGCRLSGPAYRRGDISRLQSRRLARSGRPGRHAEAIVRKLSDDLREAVLDPTTRTKLETTGNYPNPMSPSETPGVYSGGAEERGSRCWKRSRAIPRGTGAESAIFHIAVPRILVTWRLSQRVLVAQKRFVTVQANSGGLLAGLEPP